MSELVFNLRDSAKYYKRYSNIPSLPVALNQAADRIEELESRELGYIQSLRELEARVRELEGKTTEIYLENGPKFTEAQALMELK